MICGHATDRKRHTHTHTHTHCGRMGHVVYGSRVATAALGAGLVAALTPHAAVSLAFIKFTAAADFITPRRHRRRDNTRAHVVVAVTNNTSDRSPAHSRAAVPPIIKRNAGRPGFSATAVRNIIIALDNPPGRRRCDYTTDSAVPDSLPEIRKSGRRDIGKIPRPLVLYRSYVKTEILSYLWPRDGGP